MIVAIPQPSLTEPTDATFEKKRWNGSASVAPGDYQLRLEKVPDENKRWHYRLVSFVKNQSAAPTPLFLTAI